MLHPARVTAVTHRRGSVEIVQLLFCLTDLDAHTVPLPEGVPKFPRKCSSQARTLLGCVMMRHLDQVLPAFQTSEQWMVLRHVRVPSGTDGCFPCAPAVLASWKGSDHPSGAACANTSCALGPRARGIPSWEAGQPSPYHPAFSAFEGFTESRERKKSPRHHVGDAVGAPETDSLSTSRNMDYPPALAAQCHGRAHVPRGNLVMRHLAKVWPSCSYLAHSNPSRCSSWEERVRQTRSCGRVPALTFLTPILTGQQLSLCGQ